MKRIVLLVLFAAIGFTLNSCSDDSGNGVKGTISFKIDGVQKTFRSFHFNKETFPDGFTYLYFYSDSDEAGDWIQFVVEKGAIADVNHTFRHFSEGDIGYGRDSNFSIHMTTNGNDKKLVGTFEGDMISSINTVTITDGSFNIKY